MTTVLFHKGKMVADGQQIGIYDDGSREVTGNQCRKIEKINGKLYGVAGTVSEIEKFLEIIKARKTPGAKSLPHSTILEWDGQNLYKWGLWFYWAWPRKECWMPLEFRTGRKRIGGYNTIAAIGSGGSYAREFYEKKRGTMEEAIQHAAEKDSGTNKFVRAATLGSEWIVNNPYLGIKEPYESLVYSWTSTTDTSSYANNTTIWIYLKQDGTDISTWINLDYHNSTGST